MSRPSQQGGRAVGARLHRTREPIPHEGPQAWDPSLGIVATEGADRYVEGGIQ